MRPGLPAPFPLADTVVSNANLLQLITATGAAAFMRIHGMPDYFHAQQEPTGCLCTSSFPPVSHHCHCRARSGSEVGQPWAGGGQDATLGSLSLPLLLQMGGGSWRRDRQTHTQLL